MTVTRKIITFPGRNLIQTDEVVACAVPGKPEVGGAAFAPADAATYEPTPGESIASQLWEQSIHRIELSLNNTRVRAIGIAPDSPICEADIVLGGQAGEFARHRISPGNPCLVVGDYDFAQVSIPDSIPCFDGEAVDSIYWDAIRDIGAGQVIGAFNMIVGWPLRLELWQGDVLPVRTHLRAAHIAHAVCNMTTGDDTRKLYVCTSGRRHVSVVVNKIGGGASTTTIRCLAIGGQKDTANKATEDMQDDPIALPLNPAGDTSLTVTGAAPAIIIEMGAIARPILCIELVSSGFPEPPADDATEVQVHVRAED